MNFRKVKLALSVGIMNQETGQALKEVEGMMDAFQGEVGKLVDRRVFTKSNLSRSFEQQNFALQFEHCTLNVELISNLITHTEVINNFSLK
jgi:hypothetical protein